MIHGTFASTYGCSWPQRGASRLTSTAENPGHAPACPPPGRPASRCRPQHRLNGQERGSVSGTRACDRWLGNQQTRRWVTPAELAGPVRPGHQRVGRPPSSTSTFPREERGGPVPQASGQVLSHFWGVRPGGEPAPGQAGGQVVPRAWQPGRVGERLLRESSRPGCGPGEGTQLPSSPAPFLGQHVGEAWRGEATGPRSHRGRELGTHHTGGGDGPRSWPRPCWQSPRGDGQCVRARTLPSARHGGLSPCPAASPLGNQPRARVLGRWGWRGLGMIPGGARSGPLLFVWLQKLWWLLNAGREQTCSQDPDRHGGR